MIDWTYMFSSMYFLIGIFGLILFGIGIMLIKFNTLSIGILLTIVGIILLVIVGLKTFDYITRVGVN